MIDLTFLTGKPGIQFKNAMVLTMDNHQVLQNCDVRCRDGVITQIGPGLPAGKDHLIDVSGGYIMPGLIDAHVHFDQDYMGVMFLAAGVTCVRNMRGYADHVNRAGRIREGSLKGPYVESTGPIFDGEDPNIPENDNWIIRTPEDVDKGIAYTKRHGFRFMKTYPSIRPEIYRYLMRRCADEDLPVSGHMTKTIRHEELADLGYYCCEHSSSLPKEDHVIRYCAKAGMWYCPTQLVCETLPDYVWNGKKLEELDKWTSLPMCVQTEWLRRNEVISESYRQQGIRPDINVIINRGRVFMEHSDLVMAGSDCAYPGIIPGFSLWTELEKLVSLYGMSNEEALLSATARPARCMKLGGRKGRIVPGMDADLIILKENPLSDIRNIASISMVVCAGTVYTQDFFAGELEKIHELKAVEEPVFGTG
ncbi:MAG: amidohydrolase family protein [Lachnospiraceae bacterium]|nr:amidohydrolase family protein [Lachnospiraceae bacterium]